MDHVVNDVGGHRFEEDGKSRMVDYRIDDWLFELKDLQEEGLLKSGRQAKLARLFRPYATPGDSLRIDPAILTDQEQRKYFDIIASPIQTQVKSASKQIRASRARFSGESLRGGIIFLNTGYGSFPADDFGPLVERYVKKDTTQIEAVLAISTWSVTNGFDSYVYFKAHSSEPEESVVLRLREAFGTRFEQAMTRLVTGRLDQDESLSNPLTPVAFDVEGLDFAWMPPDVPATWLENDTSRVD